MKLEVKNSHTAVFGLKGEGKSNWTQWLLSKPQFSAHLIYDLCREHDVLNRYIPTHRRGDKAADELNEVATRMVVGVDRDRRPEIFALEELSRFCGPNSPPPEAVYEIIDMNRHYGVGLVTVARRPAQVHTDITELADNIIIFPLSGSNDRRKLNNTIDGLGDTVVDELGEYEYVIAQGRDYKIHRPVPEMDTTGRL